MPTIMRWRRRQDDLSRELQTHLEAEEAEQRERGLAEREARYAARRLFGNVTAVKESVRDLRPWGGLERICQDIRYGARLLWRNPGFTFAAILSLSLGIGAATSVFSAVDRILFRALPYRDDARLVSVGMMTPVFPYEFLMGAQYAQFRGHPGVFEAVTSRKIVNGIADCDVGGRAPVRARCAAVESTFLQVLGVQPLLGRGFAREEDAPNAPKTAILSYSLWQGEFGGVRGIVGTAFPLDGQPARIVGVLPSTFEMPGLERVDVLIPQQLDDATLRRAVSGWPVHVIGRMKPGMTIRQTRAALEPWFDAALAGIPPRMRREVKLRVRSLRDVGMGDAMPASWTLLAAVIAVLLISCANIANLLLARGVSRQREMAMRAALGAGRGRLLRQALTESLLLAFLGGIGGVVLAHWLLKLFVALAPQGMPQLGEARLDERVLLWALGCTVLSGILFGLAPALRESNPEALTGWRAAGRRGAARQILVSMQIAVSLVLVISASLLFRTLQNVENARLGIEADRVLTASLALGRENYPDTRRSLAFYEALEDRIRRLPGVAAAAISDSLPPNAPLRSRPFAVLQIPGREPQREGTGGTVVWRAVTPGYFSALGIAIVRGRGFDEQDRRRPAQSIILSETLARRLFGSIDVVGRRLRIGDWYTIVGVARDVKNSGSLARDDPEYYVVRSHDPADPVYRFADELRRAALIVRSPMNPEALAREVRAAVASLDPELPVPLETMRRRAGELAVRPRFNASLLGLFAGIGLLLAVIGLYGVASFLVAQRTREIGVRVALGATPAAILRLTLSRALRWIAYGCVIGVAAALSVGRLLRSLLYGVSSYDPWLVLTCVGVLFAVTIVAAFIPAIRAAAGDPVVALRQD